MCHSGTVNVRRTRVVETWVIRRQRVPVTGRWLAHLARCEKRHGVLSWKEGNFPAAQLLI
jgi:hypothetical protein